MKYIGLGLLSMVMSLLVSTALAGDFANEIAREFNMGLLPRQAMQVNLQTFTGALGGPTAPMITKSQDFNRPFQVDDDTFPDFQSAAQRSCDSQKNACAEVSNNEGGNFEVADCEKQNEDCKSSASSATVTSFFSVFSQGTDFDIICDN
ncbi:uncharacterized protein BCR38DRAFT_483022 [Pseudomassariella vexata]|uniref:Uncharacterized protein n=1 Tax=Pseudomassariella vexata TaxID=1141098 RepID=A0A1Y2E966_9PEZI|nr:uncharacterized protein BCR38DRAFT_483022 [Pseudomassariella vexata]ORY67405.1 hypothetical protein BCR38DRAFT_483022 [Pseudomassariella vexata]